MKAMRRFLAKMLVVAMVLSMMPAVANNGGKTQVMAAESFAITAPANGAIVAAGYIDIKWSKATAYDVKDYLVYVNGVKVATTTNTSYEFYTTKVQYNSVTIQVEYKNGTSKNSAPIKFGVTKKGAGLATDMGQALNLKNMGMGWYYNWGTNPSNGSQYQGIEYVPMIWKETSASNATTRINDIKNKGYKYCLTFNEPDLGGQCNMSVNDVYNVWQGFDNVTGIKISSPVTALWPSASPAWFQTFMKKIDVNNDHDTDFIAIHCYPDNYAGKGMANWFLTEVVDWTWNTYHKPIWITEFSTTGYYVTATGDNGTKEFWENVMPGLDARDYVERYAAFDFNSDSVGLWYYNTGALTPAGEVYKKLGNPVDDGRTYNIPEVTTQAPTTTTAKPTTTTAKPTTTTAKPTTTTKAPVTTTSAPVNNGNSTFTQTTRNTLLSDTAVIDNVTYTDYIAKGGVTATASSQINNGSSAANAIDANVTSRWESVHGVDPQYITLDLGSTKNIKQLSIIWETASAKDYKIQTSTNGSSFTDVATVSCNKSTQNRFDNIIFINQVSARYVRVYGTTRTTGYGYSIFDMAVYGNSTNVETTVAPTTTTKAPETTTKSNTDVSSTENIAKNKNAVSSGNEGANVAPKYAVDGNNGTRWSSNFADDAWMYVDLGGNYSVNKVVIKWEAAYGKDFKIQTSTDGNNWTTVKTVTDSKGGTNTIEFNATAARYVKMQGVKRATGYGYSIWEMEVYATGSSSNQQTTQPQTTKPQTTQPQNNNVASGTNLATKATATASGQEGDGTAAKYAIDGNDGTRFSSNFADNAWIQVDLGAVYSINAVNIKWEAAYGKAYNILVSTDGNNWTTVSSLTNQDGGTDNITFNAVNARYVKLQGVTRATGYGYSIWEMQILAK